MSSPADTKVIIKDGAKKVFKSKKERFDDPEVQAEVLYARENGLELPAGLVGNRHASAEEAKAAAIQARIRSKSTSDLKLAPKLKSCKAERKARSRGVSGSFSKKDGNRFEYGLDDWDNAEEEETDAEDKLNEDYIDYVYSFDVEKVNGFFNEYFNNGNVECAAADLESQINDKESANRVTKELIRSSLGYDQSRVAQGYKLMSELLKEEHITSKQVQTALEDLLPELEEMVKDMPKARGFLATFIAKCIADGVIGRLLFDDMTSKLNASRQAMSCALEVYMYMNNKALLKGKFEDVGAYAPLEVLRDQMEKMLREFLVSGDVDEFCNRLRELHTPHFQHELVYLVGFYALDRMHVTTMAKLAKLLKSCIDPGFSRLFKELPDLVIDIPAAYSLAEVWVKKCAEQEVIGADVAEKLPRAPGRRSRTLSESADGKFQCIDESGDLGNLGQPMKVA